MSRGLLLLLCCTIFTLATASNPPLHNTTKREKENALIFPPVPSSGLPEKLLVIIPGADVPNHFYTLTAKAIQESAAQLELWVVVPSTERCIFLCFFPGVCGALQDLVQSAVSEAIAQGYLGSTAAPDVWVAGHSMGSACADNLVQGLLGTASSYSGLVMLAGAVRGLSVSEYPLPVQTLGAELNGGSTRPGVLSRSAASSDEAALEEGGGLDSAWQLTHKPVAVIPGINHGGFCPGFRVPGDVRPPDVDEEEAVRRIGSVVAAFLEANSGVPQDALERALNTLRSGSTWSREFLSPVFATFAMEVSDDLSYATYCPQAQRSLAALRPEDDERLLFSDAVYRSDAGEFSSTRVTFQVDEEASTVAFNVSGRNTYYEDADESCIVAAREIGCKLASAASVKRQLNINAQGDEAELTCLDVNRATVRMVEELLEETEAGQTTLRRYRERGRPIILQDDTDAVIGPLFVSGSIRIEDGEVDGVAGLLVSSLKLGPQPLDGPIFPGTHYCKLLSPARVLDFMMIDSLKDKSGCLNIEDVGAN